LSDLYSNILSIWPSFDGFVSGLVLSFHFSTIFDVLIVAILFYWIYMFLYETRALRILYGFLILFFAMLLAKIFDLVLLNYILGFLTTALAISIPIVFQPELRHALEKLGRPRFWSDIKMSKDDFSKLLDEISLACDNLSKQKIGALIVIQRTTGLREYIENGISVEAKVSSGIINSIFYPKSPLHDGATIIVGTKIISASSILPVAEVEAGRNMGTRHRAAIGITQVSDAVAIVVSEETGSLSIAVGGEIERRISEERLKTRLSRLLRKSVKKDSSSFLLKKFEKK